MTDARGTPTQFAVNQLNQVVQVVSESAAPSQTPAPYLRNIYYDANNRVTSVDVQNKDEFGTVGANAFFTTSFTYDSLDRRTAMTREVDAGHTVTTQYFYDAVRNLTEARSPLAVSAAQPDARVQYTYDERNLPFTATSAPSSPNATGSRYTYDPNGNLTRMETGAPAATQHITDYVYDGFDRLSSRISPVNTQLSLIYNANHQPTQRTVVGTFLNAAGNPTTGTLASSSFIYDSSGYCTGRIDSFFDIVIQVPILDGARTTTYNYDPARNLTSVTDDNSHIRQYSYDGANRVSRVTDPKGNRTDYTYDENGNLVAATRTDKSDTAAPDQAFATTYVYDGLNRLLTATDNVGNARSYLYDSRSNCARYVDPRNNLTQYEYDGLNRLIRSGRDMNANSSGFDVGTDIISGRSWDDNSRLISQNDPNSHATQYQYDPLSRRIQRTNADTTTKTWSYDPWGNAIQSNDENATLCINSYDSLNRIKQRQITPGAGVSAATTLEVYDYPGDYSWPERAINDAGAVRYTYDSLGRVLTEKLNNRTTTYTYDGVGNTLTLQSPGGRTVTYAYDTANLCTSLSLTATGDGDSLGSLASYKYIGGRLESVTHRNGTSTSYTYDGFVGAPASSDLGWGRLAASVTSGPGPTVIDQRTFTYDAAQNLKERHDTRPGGPQLLHHYDYDAANRHVHTQVTAGGPPLRDTIYTYDLNGNRINVNGAGTPNPGLYTQNATTPSPADAQMNQYTSTPLGNYLYDANGNRTNLNGGGGNTNYKYDYRNRLVDLTNATTSVRIANYQYDALGRRIQKTLDPDGTPSVINFVYSGRKVLEERDGAGALNAVYTSLKDDPFFFDIPAELLYRAGAQRGGGGLGRGMFAGLRDDPFFFDVPAELLYRVEMRRGGANYSYHAEVVPWLWLMSNTSGGAAERYDYEDFGDPHIFDGSGAPLPSSAIGNPYLFKGMRFDGESGFYLNHRTFFSDDDDPTKCPLMFDPKIGASLQRESTHATNGWSGGPLIWYYSDPWAWDPGQPMLIPIDP